MNKRVALCGSLALFVLGTCALAQDPAPTAPTTSAVPAGVKVAIINIQRAIVESNEGKKAADDLTKRFTPVRSELQKMQDEIAKLQKQLETGSVLSDEARANLVREVERKTKEFNRKNDDANSDFQQAEGQLINSIGQKVMKVIDEYARKNSFDVILDVSSPQSNVLWATNRLDITEDIIGAYNAAGGAAAPAPSGAGAPASSGGGATRSAPGSSGGGATKPGPATQPAAKPPASKPPAPKPPAPQL